jgi:chromosomal replication initiator protein
MATLEHRLQSRFGVGVLVAIAPPDPQTRILIARAKSKQLCLDLKSEIIEYIATNLSDNIRQIEGALKKIRAFRDLAGMELTMENVVHAIEDMQTGENSVLVTPALIVRNVCKYYGVEEDILKGPQRSRNISEPRQVAMYLMRQMLNMSQDEIAKVFSRERTTVVHALKQVEKTIQLKGNKLDPILQDLQSNIAASL